MGTLGVEIKVGIKIKIIQYVRRRYITGSKQWHLESGNIQI